MADLTKEEVVALGHAVGLEIQDPSDRGHLQP